MTIGTYIEEAIEALETLEISRVEPRPIVGGTWVDGTIAGHRFNALLFPQHADHPDYELAESRISKLWIQRASDRATVANFDRGWDVRPTTPAAEVIVGLLIEGLAEHAQVG